jgi:hypothetical protein
MSQALRGLTYNGVELLSLNGTKRIDLTNSIIETNYYEDILSPCITMTMQIAITGNVYNGLPIRGGEKVVFDITTGTGDFKLDGDYGMYVYKVSNYASDGIKEIFTLHLISREGLTNETSRVQKKYKKVPINDHVTDILKNVLKTNKYKSQNIERTSNSYSFIGNQKKPFHILTWLGPKGIPSTTSSGVNGQRAKGVAGFLFYETKDGFNFKSIDKLVSATSSGSSTSNNIPIYSYSSAIESNQAANNFRILNYYIEKNVDLMKSLRVGMYANKTYYFDLYKNTLDLYDYYLKDEIKNKLGGQGQLIIPDDFKESFSRILVRTSDRGTLDPNDISGDSGRDNADMAKSFSRYNLLFTQSLNMVVPCNVNLRAGQVIEAQFPKVEASKSAGVDEQQSGKYLIKELRHHFEANNMVTSLKLVRDSYGLY